MSDVQATTPTKADTQSDFRVYANSDLIKDASFYFIESTAPDNVERRADSDDSPPAGLTPVDPKIAARQIAERLTQGDGSDDDANLVVMVHGFNNPRPNVLEFYRTAVEALDRDQSAIFGAGRRIICVGFRWPSESVGSALSSWYRAMPLFPLWLFRGAGGVLILRVLDWLFGLPRWLLEPALWLTPAAVVLIAIILVLVALRAIVYFRDIYRATNYGVPDLVEVIRQIDKEACDLLDKRKEKASSRKRVALSFIGHSMGGLVVTNAIRVLSDVFDPAVILSTDLSGATSDAPARLAAQAAQKDAPARPGPVSERSVAPASEDQVSGKIGHIFTLMRFVLASPDIPAEALLADRANFLASSLRRFREAYLLSSEGDEVLRMISTTVNYFSFPTRRRNFGYRLGNAEILSSGFGSISNGGLLAALRVGCETLASLSNATRRGKHRTIRTSQNPAEVAEAFTYFDCTDYVDDPNRKAYLTEAKNYKAHDPHGHIPYLEHLNLLWKYVSPWIPADKRINVHGGYFDGAVTQRLIYRLGCLGYKNAMKAYGDETAMLSQCSEHQIRVMLSSRLSSSALSREYIETPGMTAMLRSEVESLRNELKQKDDFIRKYAKESEPKPTIVDEGDAIVIDGIRLPKRKAGDSSEGEK
jgi:hypothetical protein